MVQISWVQLNPDTFYYTFKNYVFKKKQVNAYCVYSIWEDDYIQFNTYNEYQFLKLAGRILNGLPFDWKRA